MNRNRFALAALAVLGLACRPPTDTFDAGCYPAPISQPTDAGAPQCQAWTGGCDSNGVAALENDVTNLFTSTGQCSQDSDCALWGAPIAYQCYERSFTPPINLGKRPQMDAALANLLCGFCQACFADGGILQGDVSPPQPDAGCTEVQCSSGQCVVFNPGS